MQVAMAAMIIGGATKAYAGYEGARAERSERFAQARVEQVNASIEAYQARREAERLAGVKRRGLSTLRANFAANKVASYSGSAEDITFDTAVQLELDERNARYRQTAVTQVGAERAKNLRKSGKAAYNSGILTTIGSAVSTAGSAYAMGNS